MSDSRWRNDTPGPSRRRFLQTTLTSGSVAALEAGRAVAAAVPRRPAGRAIYLTDLDRCLPASALTPRRTQRCWQTLAYAAESVKGVMLAAGEETDAAEIEYPLDVRGWHAVYLGMYSESQTASILVKLSRDPAFVTASREQTSYFEARIEDIYWKSADLTGQRILFRQSCIRVVPPSQEYGNACTKAYLAYIKLLPLSAEEIERAEADRRRGHNRRLFAHDDAWSYHGRIRPVVEADVRREVEPYRNTDFSRLYWEGAAGDRCNYLSRIGRLPTDDSMRGYPRVNDRLAAESWRILRDRKIDPFKVALEAAHEMGMEFHACFRTEAFVYAPPHEEWAAGGFWERHPELRCVGPNGQEVPRISYAFPETQDFVLSILREMADQAVDGLCLLYNRRPPMVVYEKPLVDGFQKEYGQDPRRLDDRDPRWLAYRSTALTGFMRRVRKEMEDAARRKGRARRLPVSAWVLQSEEENTYHGLDLKTWVREGLVDTLIPYGSVRHQYGPWNPRDVQYFVNLVRGTSCALAFNTMPRVLAPEEFWRRAHDLYAAGVENLAFWDCNGRFHASHSWEALQRLGHREEIEAWARSGRPAHAVSGQSIRKLAGIDMTYSRPG
jgi:hypothetical protein